MSNFLKANNISKTEQFFEQGSIFSCSHDQVLLGFGERVQRNGEPTFYFPDFFLTENNKLFSHETHEIIALDRLRSQLEPQKILWDWLPLNEEFFSRQFDKLKEMFHKGRLIKAVPYLFAEAKLAMSPQLLSHLLYHALNYASRHPVYVYGFWLPGKGLLGVTPELLFEQKSNRLTTMACAGSCRTGELAKLNRPKEQLEHQLVVEQINQRLARYGEVHCGQTKVQAFGPVAHLITPIQLQTSAKHPFETFIHALHPTAALGALPGEAGAKWLRDYQTICPRGHYGAPAALQHNGKVTCVVGIRNVQWDERSIRIGVGCGVVADSNKEEEWAEVQLKFEAIRQIFGI